MFRGIWGALWGLCPEHLVHNLLSESYRPATAEPKTSPCFFAILSSKASEKVFRGSGFRILTFTLGVHRVCRGLRLREGYNRAQDFSVECKFSTDCRKELCTLRMGHLLRSAAFEIPFFDDPRS